MACIIQWNTLNLEQWKQRFLKISRSTILQSYEYAKAACGVYLQTARWGVIYINNQEAGLVQIQEAALFGRLFHAVILDRGPLWFDGFGSQEDFAQFSAALSKEFPRRFGRRRRFIPEVKDGPAMGAIMAEHGFKHVAGSGYQTLWLDLSKSEEALYKGLKKKWRGSLTKAQKSGLEIEWDWTGAHFPWLLMHYSADKIQKGYDGPSLKMLKALAQHFVPEQNMVIGRAMLDNQPVAAILLLCHGQSATYQIGWSSDEGRKSSAHNLLLWEALAALKAKGIQSFDLGGVNDDTAKGVKTFKEGMGGKSITLSGLYS